MHHNLSAHTEVINKSLDWIKKNKSAEFENRFLELVGQRRLVKNIARALHEKPAIAAYGESQKGKSYLIGILLQKDKSPFMVKDEQGNDVDFVARINPITFNTEATGVVTRFTPFNEGDGKNRYCPEHPVIVKLLSLANIATILCDSYNNDLTDTQFYADDEIRDAANRIYERYRSMPSLSNPVVTADDILDIKDYLEKNVNKAQGIVRSGYFEKLALVIDKIPQGELDEVFSYLWHENHVITKFFKRMHVALAKLDFASEVYTDFDAVMHLGDNVNTIMSVDCLNGLDDPDWKLNTTVYLRNGNSFKAVNNFQKCELSALCAETIFKVGKEYLDEEEHFFFDESHDGQPGYMTSSNKRKLPSTVNKGLLRYSDLLDFPGARNRLKILEKFLDGVDNSDNEESKASNMVQMFLRGKVAFLFNHYSESHIINIFLFCHDGAKAEVNDMWRLIQTWVDNYVGETPEERRRTTERCGGVPPLFNIATKFNIDMMEKKGDIDGSSDSALHNRWYSRFFKVLQKESFRIMNVDWFNNWDMKGRTFCNTYLLRDFKYSGCDGQGNNLFRGYNKNDERPSEKSMELTPDFYERMKQTFISDAEVKKFFDDPALAWDAAATINNDGALYVISQMGVVAKHIGANREEQFDTQLDAIGRKVSEIMKGYYVSDDTAEILRENIRKANNVFREVEFACQVDPSYFGHLIQAMQMSESECFKAVHKLIPELINIVTDTKTIEDYELIRRRCDNFRGCDTVDDMWDRFMQNYRFSDREEAGKFLQDRKIDPEILFQKKSQAVKRKNSAVITDALLSLWRSKLTDVAFVNDFSGGRMPDELTLGYLIQGLIASAEFTGLAEHIEESIADSVNVLNTNAIKEELVSDLIATGISDFVTDFGHRYLTDEQLETSRRVSRDNHLPIFDWLDRERTETYDEDNMTDLLNDILNSSRMYTPAYEANYNTWLENMFLSFIADVRVPEFDRDANDSLKAILDINTAAN